MQSRPIQRQAASTMPVQALQQETLGFHQLETRLPIMELMYEC